jgi:heme/copper-type cytochrome/quinol oxidase subunit 2
MTELQVPAIVTMIVMFATAIIGLRAARLNNVTAKINAAIAIANAQKTNVAPLKNKNNRSAFLLFVTLNIFIVISVLIVSFDLYKDFHSLEPITRSSIFNTCFLFLLLVINLLSLCMNWLYKYVGEYVDGLLDVDEELFGYIKDLDTKHTAAFNKLNEGE